MRIPVELLVLIAGPLVGWMCAHYLSESARIWLAHESAPIEILHTGLCLISALLFYDSYRRGRDEVKVAGLALALLATAALLREQEWRAFSDAAWYQWIVHHGLQEILFVSLLIPIPIYLWSQRRHLRGLIALAFRPQATALYLAGLLLAAGIVLDERIVHDSLTRFWEEYVETVGYVFMAIAAMRHRALVDSPRTLAATVDLPGQVSGIGS